MLFENHSNSSIFDEFERTTANEVFSICYILKKFRIVVITIEDYKQLTNVPSIEGLEEQPMANFVFKYEQDASTTHATIIVNEKVCKSFGFSKSELFAIIAHEIGHIIYFFSDCKEPDNKQAEEIFADHIAELLGLKNELKEVINKLITSELFDYKTINLLKIRKLMLV